MMTPEATNSWIILAVAIASSKSLTTLSGIIEVADGINRAVPTHKELQNAFGWLSKQDLIFKENNKYQLAHKGLALHGEASAKSKRLLGVWDYLKEHFLTLNSEPDVDSLTAEEVGFAYNKYNKKFWEERHQ